MFKRIVRNGMRRPAYSIAVVLVTAVLTIVLCYLHRTGQEELHSYEQTFASIPVLFRVTDLDGSKPSTIPGWIADLFTDQGMQPNIAPYVGKLYSRVSRTGTLTDANGMIQNCTVAGIGALYVAEELTENWGGQTYWFEGYDESILVTQQLVCLVPESMKDIPQVELQFQHTYSVSEHQTTTKSVSRIFQVIGYYVDKGNTTLYCPYGAMTELHAELAAAKEVKEVCAVLKDNSRLPQLRQAAADWFAEPNPSGEKTPWGRFDNDYYLYALDIDDYMLRSLESNMKSSMQLNQLASVVVFILSAGAGFFTGFLIIRARKREIALMRTLGASHAAIFLDLALEQTVCVLTGILLGGIVFLWQPIDRLAIFGGIYAAGLALALMIFLRKNLLTTIKEDE